MTCQPDGSNQGSGLTADGLRQRTVTISREPALGTGNVGYRGLQQSLETVIFSGLAASIQYVMRGPDPLSKVPSDRVGRGLWRVFIATGAVPTGAIHRDDICTDDLNRRYKLNEPFWGAINIQIEAELLGA